MFCAIVRSSFPFFKPAEQHSLTISGNHNSLLKWNFLRLFRVFPFILGFNPIDLPGPDNVRIGKGDILHVSKTFPGWIQGIWYPWFYRDDDGVFQFDRKIMLLIAGGVDPVILHRHIIHSFPGRKGLIELRSSLVKDFGHGERVMDPFAGGKTGLGITGDLDFVIEGLAEDGILTTLHVTASRRNVPLL